MKSWKSSLTVWFNVIAIVVGVAGELLAAFPSGTVAKISGYVLAIGNILIRVYKTNTGIGTEK